MKQKRDIQNKVDSSCVFEGEQRQGPFFQLLLPDLYTKSRKLLQVVAICH